MIVFIEIRLIEHIFEIKNCHQKALLLRDGNGDENLYALRVITP